MNVRNGFVIVGITLVVGLGVWLKLDSTPTPDATDVVEAVEQQGAALGPADRGLIRYAARIFPSVTG